MIFEVVFLPGIMRLHKQTEAPMPKDMTHGNPLTAVMEDYLETIYHLVQEHGFARSGQISKRLGVHKSTVTTALHNLQSQGYIDYAPYQEVTMTPKGVKEAEGIVRRHDIFYRLLHNLLGVAEDEASYLACEMEHSIPPHIVERFIGLVEDALRKNELHEYAMKNNSEARKIAKKIARKESVRKRN